MDVSKIKKAIDEATAGVNTLSDELFKGRRLNGLRSLDLANKALALAQKHVEKAAEQSAPKAAAEPAAAAGAKK